MTRWCVLAQTIVLRTPHLTESLLLAKMSNWVVHVCKNVLQVLKCRLLTQSWYNDDAIKVAQSPGSQLTPGSPESPLPSSSGQREEWGERDGGTERERGIEHGPLVQALLSKLERLLDQVLCTSAKCVYETVYTLCFQTICLGCAQCLKAVVWDVIYLFPSS